MILEYFLNLHLLSNLTCEGKVSILTWDSIGNPMSHLPDSPFATESSYCPSELQMYFEFVLIEMIAHNLTKRVRRLVPGSVWYKHIFSCLMGVPSSTFVKEENQLRVSWLAKLQLNKTQIR